MSNCHSSGPEFAATYLHTSKSNVRLFAVLLISRADQLLASSKRLLELWHCWSDDKTSGIDFPHKLHWLSFSTRFSSHPFCFPFLSPCVPSPTPKIQLGSLADEFLCILDWKILAGDNYHSITNFSPRQNLVGSSNGLDPTNLKIGRVWNQGPRGNQRLWTEQVASILTENLATGLHIFA